MKYANINDNASENAKSIKLAVINLTTTSFVFAIYYLYPKYVSITIDGTSTKNARSKYP